jgi:leader peptidase (prepilin peptidase) / N-methyltransferase
VQRRLREKLLALHRGMLRPDVATRDVMAAGLAFLALFGALSAPLLWRPETATDLLAASLVLAAALAALSAIDLHVYRLPDMLTLPLGGLGLLVSTWSGAMPLWWSALSAVLAFLLLAGIAAAYRHVRGRAGLGLGDAKLMAASGAWLGLEALPTVLLWATAAALICALVASWRGQPMTGTTRLPFGPFLAFATWLVWLYGPL